MKMHQKVFVHITPKKFENAEIFGHFEFLRVRKTRAGKLHDNRGVIVFKKLRFQSKVFLVQTKTGKAGVFKFLRFKERFRKVPFP